MPSLVLKQRSEDMGRRHLRVAGACARRTALASASWARIVKRSGCIEI
jgi:hypothetical protein